MKKRNISQELNETFKQIERAFGRGSIMVGDEVNVNVREVISTGSPSINAITGVDGVPKGRIIEIYGPESSGKTTLALHIVAEAQKAGDIAAFIDAEHALDTDYAGNLGVDMDSLLISQPDTGEQALEITESLVKSKKVGLIVVDSVAALVPRAEIEGEMGDANMGLHARLMSQAMRKLNGVISKTNCCVVFINQIRMKIGVIFGNPEITTGGRALKFYTSMRIDIRRTGSVKDGEDIVGNKTKIKIVKNKVAPPFKSCNVEIRFGIGIDIISEIIDLALEYGVIEKLGTWFSYGDERLGQGREKVRQLLVDNEDLYTEIRKRLLGE